MYTISNTSNCGVYVPLACVPTCIVEASFAAHSHNFKPVAPASICQYWFFAESKSVLCRQGAAIVVLPVFAKGSPVISKLSPFTVTEPKPKSACNLTVLPILVYEQTLAVGVVVAPDASVGVQVPSS